MLQDDLTKSEQACPLLPEPGDEVAKKLIALLKRSLQLNTFSAEIMDNIPWDNVPDSAVSSYTLWKKEHEFLRQQSL